MCTTFKTQHTHELTDILPRVCRSAPPAYVYPEGTFQTYGKQVTTLCATTAERIEKFMTQPSR